MRGEALLAVNEVLDLAFKHDFAAKGTCHRPDVDDVVGGTDDLLVVFHHDDGIADVAQAFQHLDELLGVAGMQADTGLVQDIGGADQTAAQRSREVDTL